MQADTASLCKFLQVWRCKTDDSRYCCDQQKTTRGKARFGLRAPTPGVSASKWINQHDVGVTGAGGDWKRRAHACLVGRFLGFCPLTASHTRMPAARARRSLPERASPRYSHRHTIGRAPTRASPCTPQNQRRGAAYMWCARGDARYFARH